MIYYQVSIYASKASLGSIFQCNRFKLSLKAEDDGQRLEKERNFLI